MGKVLGNTGTGFTDLLAFGDAPGLARATAPGGALRGGVAAVFLGAGTGGLTVSGIGRSREPAPTAMATKTTMYPQARDTGLQAPDGPRTDKALVVPEPQLQSRSAAV
jgi:hypothetical protein